MNHRRRSVGSVAALVTTAISLAVAVGLLMNRQLIIDQLNVWQYVPSSQVQKLADRTGMSDKGEFYFYASQPSLEDRQAFNGHCTNQDSNTAILGCYSAQRIYIYDIKNEKLNGIRSVTAAHEMLHAAYERMSDTERTAVNAMVEKEYAKLRDDKKLAARMAFYAKTEPGERDNELYAVIGTEVAKVDTPLEQHYDRYFDDRQKTVTLHASYEAVFTQLQNRADDLTARLNALSASIENNSSQYNAQVGQLNTDIRQFNAKANSGGFRNQAEFDEARSSLVARADALDSLRSQINTSIATYDSLQKELAGIASQSDELNRSINSSLAPAPSL